MIMGIIKKIAEMNKPLKNYLSSRDFTAEMLDGDLVITFISDACVSKGDTITLKIQSLPIKIENGMLHGEMKEIEK